MIFYECIVYSDRKFATRINGETNKGRLQVHKPIKIYKPRLEPTAARGKFPKSLLPCHKAVP